jgi:hypothetical protein
MFQKRLDYYMDLDENAKLLAREYSNKSLITEKILKIINSLYQYAKIEQEFKDEFFESAYHSPITGELEFLIARILFHFSQLNGKGWKIYLRRQESKTAPDIRLLKGNKTFAIIEVKAKAGWIQPFLSPERYNNDKNKFNNKKSKHDPDILISSSRSQLDKYFKTFKLESKDVYLFLPTLALVHRKKYLTDLPEYYNYFASTSGLPAENLIHLSRSISQLEPTDNFERLLERLS